MVIFYCLCSKYKMMNTKAKFMIVTPTNPKKSSLMITNNTDSTIAPPPVVSLTSYKPWNKYVHIKELKVATHSAYSHFLCLLVQYILTHLSSKHHKFLQLLLFISFIITSNFYQGIFNRFIFCNKHKIFKKITKYNKLHFKFCSSYNKE